MSNNNSTSKSALNKAKPPHFALAGAHAMQGLKSSAAKAGVLLNNPPTSPLSAAALVGRTALAGAKSYGKAAGYAGLGLAKAALTGAKSTGNAVANAGRRMMQGFAQQHPSPGQNLNNMKIGQILAQGRSQRSSAIQAARRDPQRTTNRTAASNALKSRSMSSAAATQSAASSASNKALSGKSSGAKGSGASIGSSNGGKSGGSSKTR